MSEYIYRDIVKLGISAASVRVPPLQTSVRNEFGDMLSRELDDWTQADPPLNSKGMTVEEYLDSLILTRPHWLVPATVVSAADTTWLDGSLTAQGKRWKELRAFLGSDAATNAAMAAEAAIYGAVPGSTKKGVKPGSKTDPDVKSVSDDNPWGDAYFKRHGPEAAVAEQTRLIKLLGTDKARGIAKGAGVNVFGTKLKS